MYRWYGNKKRHWSDINLTVKTCNKVGTHYNLEGRDIFCKWRLNTVKSTIVPKTSKNKENDQIYHFYRF